MTQAREDILKQVKDRDIHGIWVWFTDILGQLKGVEIAPSELEDAMAHGTGFDGSSVEGFARIHESDLMAVLDPSTFREMELGGARMAHMFCDLVTPEGTPYPGDTRHALKRMVQKISQQGWTFNVGAELEFFYFKSAVSREPFDATGYFDASLVNQGTLLRQKTVRALTQMGVRCEYSHHEVAPSQHEIDVRYMDALRMADTVMLVRFLTKEIASQAGAYATFMPKPIFGENGSGMHVHQSLSEAGRNIFYDANDTYNLSATARSYIAGLLRHVREATLVFNPTVNSYKRLIPGYEAPVYISWGQKNRSALVRVPRMRVGQESSARCELRSPDPVANPYLAFATMLGAGLKGIDEKLRLEDANEDNIFAMTPEVRGERGIAELPGSLAEAISAAENSDLLCEVLGKHIYTQLLDNKRIEWDRYRVQVSDYELSKYLPIY